MRPGILLVLLCGVVSAHDWNGIARERGGALVVIDADEARVWRVDAGGGVSSFLPSVDLGGCNHPHHLAFDPQGTLWIPSG